jgi:cytidylate kinase
MKSIAQLMGEYNRQLEERQVTGAPSFYPSIVISRQPGSGGLDIAKMLAERLGFQLWDKNLLNEAAARGHIATSHAHRFDERQPSLLQTIGVHFITLSTAPTPEEFDAHLKQSVRSLLRAGGVVMLGRGAAYLAKPKEALRIRVVAPLEDRVHNWMKRMNVPERTARHEISEIEHARAAFLKRAFGKSETDPDCFDLAFNTHDLSMKSCVNISLAAYDEKFGFTRHHRHAPDYPHTHAVTA